MRDFNFLSSYLNLTTFYTEATKTFKDVSEYWKKNKIHPEIFPVFNWNLRCLNSICPYQLMKPVNCTIYQNNVLEINIEIINVKRKKIIHVKTLDHIRKINNRTCTLHYEGDEYFIKINDTCVIPIEKPNSHIIIWEENQQTCYPFNDKWKIQKCYVDNETHVQILETENAYIMYCHKHQIYVNNISTQCPDFPFLLDNTFGFTPNKNINLTSTYTLNTTFQDYPLYDELQNITFDSLDRIINNITIDNLDDVPFNNVQIDTIWIYIAISFGSGFLVLIISKCLYCFCKKKRNQSGNVNIELHDLNVTHKHDDTVAEHDDTVAEHDDTVTEHKRNKYKQEKEKCSKSETTNLVEEFIKNSTRQYKKQPKTNKLI